MKLSRFVLKFKLKFLNAVFNIGGSKSDTRDAPGSISFIFLQFSEKIWSNDRLAPRPLV